MGAISKVVDAVKAKVMPDAMTQVKVTNRFGREVVVSKALAKQMDKRGDFPLEDRFKEIPMQEAEVEEVLEEKEAKKSKK